MWGYRKNGITKEFAEKDDLMDFLEKCDREASFQLRYWHVDENFDDYDLKYSLILGCRKQCLTSVCTEGASGFPTRTPALE